MVKISWTQLKQYIATNSSSYQYVQDDNSYMVIINDSTKLYSIIPITEIPSPEQLEFETSYKSLAGQAGSQYDTDGAPIVRNKAAKKGWTFCSMPIEFETSRRSNKMYSKTADGSDRSFITLRVYDANDTELTDDGVLYAGMATAVKTVIDFEPPHDYEVIGGELRTLTTISADMRLWLIAAPDVAAPLGSKEMGGGINLKYLAPGNVWAVDGRVTKYATYSAAYHTGKIRLIFKYDAGTNESLQVVVQMYKL